MHLLNYSQKCWKRIKTEHKKNPKPPQNEQKQQQQQTDISNVVGEVDC